MLNLQLLSIAEGIVALFRTMKRLIGIFIFLGIIGVLGASGNDAYRDYIDQYAQMAIEQQEAYRIPASITLAQGLLESAAGRSTLATRGNNHFGIKCHKEWEGDTLLRSDDAPNECFRAYRTAGESFHDHSRFLSRKRYAKLFELDETDYEGWARGLRECGYATDPNYAQRLITIIERYGLYLYDTAGGRLAEENAEFIRNMLTTTHKVRRSRGLHYVIAAPGDKYSDIAKEFNLDVKKLLAYNDAKKDGRIKDWEEVYLEDKLEAPADGISRATVGEGESFHSLAQRFGIKLSVIKALNPGVKDRAGSEVRLR